MHLKSLQEFLDDAGNTPLEIKWTKTSNEWNGFFIIEEVKFKIQIKKNSEYCDRIEVFEFKFTRDGSTKLINDFKYPFQVVPTIKEALSSFLKEHKPAVIGFVGNKDDKGRVKLYEKNAKFYADKYDYKLYLDRSSDYYAFVLYKDDEFENCVKELLKDKN